MKPVGCGHFAEVIGGICQNGWARQSGSIFQDHGKYFLWSYGSLDHHKQLILLHWAGYKLNSLMPYRKLFNKFYLEKKPIFQSCLFYLNTALDYLWRNPVEVLRQNRLINSTYHFLKKNH
jgi:hypothetical protein